MSKFKIGDIVKITLAGDENGGQEGYIIMEAYSGYIVEFLNPYRKGCYGEQHMSLWYRWEDGWATVMQGVSLENIDGLTLEEIHEYVEQVVKQREE